jgi:hypothetical protein
MSKIQGTSTKTEKSVKNLGNNFAAFNLIINRLPGPLKDIASGMLGMVSPATAAAGAIISLSSAAIQFGKDSLQAFGEFELIRANLELTMGSVEKANDVFSQVKDFAMKTPFDVAGTAQAVNMLKQAGIATNDLISTLEILGNVSGGNMERFNRIAYNYVQVLQKGVLDTRDTREFAGNLVPINKALQAIGVTGKATADDMVRAFQYMTQEGSMFYNAINRQADTYIGKTNQAKEALVNFKAAFAENTGLGDAAKEFLTSLTETLNNYTDFFNKNTEAKNNPNDPEAQISLLGIQKKLYQEELEFKEKEQKIAWDIFRAIGIKSIENKLSLLDEELKSYQDILDANKAINDALAARSAHEEEWQGILEQSGTDYLTLQTQIQEEYAKTNQDQKEVLEAQIAEWRERQKATHMVEQVMPWSNGLKIASMEGISEEENNQIERIIVMLTESLNKLTISIKKSRAELLDWQKILQQNTGFSEDQISAWHAGKVIIDQFSDSIRLQEQAQIDFANLMGTDTVDVINGTAEAWEQLVNAMTTSVKWDEATQQFIKVWDGTEESYKNAVEQMKLAQQAADDVNFDNYLQGLNDEYAILTLETEELREQARIRKDLQDMGLNPSPEQVEMVQAAQQRNNAQSFHNELQTELDLILKSSHDEAVARLMIERNINDIDADRLLKEQKSLEYIKNGADYMAQLQDQLENALESIRAGNGGYGEASDAMIGQAGLQMAQGTDVGNFAQGMSMGGPIMGIINTVINALVKVASSAENFEKAMNPVTEILDGIGHFFDVGFDEAAQFIDDFKDALTPLFEIFNSLADTLHPLAQSVLEPITMVLKDIMSILSPVVVIIKALQPVFEGLLWVVRQVMDGLRWFLNVITFGLLDQLGEMAESIKRVDEEERDRMELLKALNAQYEKLGEAIEAQEEYYLKKRRNLYADWGIEQTTRVNDMILTPQGKFSTHPDDYIIATKNPETLSSHGTVVNIVVHNEAGDVATATAQQSTGPDGMTEIAVLVRKLVANDIANGKMENAFAAREQRNYGKRVSG